MCVWQDFAIYWIGADLVGQPRVVLMKTEIYEEKKSPNMHSKVSVINSSEEEKTYMLE